MLKLKLQYFGHLMQIADLFKKTLMLGRIEGGGEGNDQGWDGWMASLTQWTWVWVNSGSWWWAGRPGMLQSMWSQRVGHDWVTELNWTELKVIAARFLYCKFWLYLKSNLLGIHSELRKCPLLPNLSSTSLMILAWISYDVRQMMILLIPSFLLHVLVVFLQ